MSANDPISTGVKAAINGFHASPSAMPRTPEPTPDGVDHTASDVRTPTTPQEANDPPAQDGPARRLLLDHYGVESRNEQPRKKVKTVHNGETDDSKIKGTFQHKGNGIIGEYMNEKADTEDKPPTVSAVVDLTNDDDDELQIVGARNKVDDEIVCFGRLWLRFNAYLCPKPKKKAQYISDQQWPHIRCTVSRKFENIKNIVIGVNDEFDKEFAHIHPEEAPTLTKAMDGLVGFRVQAMVLPRAKKADEWPHQAMSHTLRGHANFYGRRGDVEKVGRLFGQANMFFNSPSMPDPAIPYINPHAQKRTKTQIKVGGGSNPRPVLDDYRSNEEVAQHMASMIDEWSRKQDKELPETEPPASVTTPLLSHQKQGLTFMLNREKPRTYEDAEDALHLSLWRKKISATKGMVYEDIVSGIRVSEEPAQVFGGLLADVMGVGKTLEALSLVASTTEEAEKFGKDQPNRRNPEDEHVRAHSKATLIVCPTSTVQNWENQIREHLDNDRMMFYVYHGQTRTNNAWDLKKFDLVVTTYGTVASDFRGLGSPLKQLKWFRVMLDEAHTIREPKAQQSQACYSLNAQRRWALTGTPIQNRISDLGSLTRFLRMYPYNDTGFFNQQIGSKAVASDESYLDKLRLFVDSFCLRRDKGKIDLKGRSDMVSRLKFSDEERRMHSHFKEKAMIQIEELIKSKNKKSGVHLHMLKGITTLRLICAHGRDLLKEADLRELQGMTESEPIDIDEYEGLRTINKRQAYENFNMMMEAESDFCMQCDSRVTGESPQASDVDDEGARAYMLPCLDLLCANCFSMHKEMFDSTEDQYAVECPFCGLDVAAQYILIEASQTENLDVPDDTLNGAEDGKFSKYKGPQTKVKALLKDIAQMKEESKPLEEQGERPLKCVVFSEFTSNLTLIEKALTNQGYTFARIDGSMSLNARRKVLDALETDDSLTILLASIKAAGQGLNLTAASRAFIMEPMWNPAAEAQAVDRVHRIGQARDVIIKRYQIEDSIEMKIVELARKKMVLAQVSMDGGKEKKLSKSEQRAQNLKDIVSLFK